MYQIKHGRIARGTVLSAVAAVTVMVSLAFEKATAQGLSCPGNVVRYIVPYPPGSPIDIMIRAIAHSTVGPLGTNIIIENKTGASGSVGAAEVAKSPPDGCTVLATIADPIVSNPVLMSSIGYDVNKDFAFVTKLGYANPGLVANPRVKANTLSELVQEAKASKTPLKYGSYGPGSFPHLIVASFARQAGIELDHVAYRGPPQMLQAVVQGEIDLGTGGGNAVSLLDEGKLKGLAQIGPKRAWVRDVPTFAEEGYTDLIFRTPIWVGLLVPAKTPKVVVEKLASASKIALADPQTRKILEANVLVPTGSSPQEFEAEWRAEFEAVGTLIRTLGITAQQ